MSKTATEYRDAYMDAIEDYMSANHIQTDYETAFSWNNEIGYYGVFDMPSDYVPFKNGGIDDRPECRMKPVLIARLLPDGSITVEETEHTEKYMKRMVKTA